MSNHTQRKLSKVCNEDSYVWLHNWIIAQYPHNPYPFTPMQFFYKNTSHREYLSKWIESVIVKVLRSRGADPQKAPDAGTYRDNSKIVHDVLGRQRKIGSGGWTKNNQVRKGRADVTCFFNGKMYLMEVKVGADRMSDAQKQEQQRAESNGETYVVIKTIEDFLGLL